MHKTALLRLSDLFLLGRINPTSATAHIHSQTTTDKAPAGDRRPDQPHYMQSEQLVIPTYVRRHVQEMFARHLRYPSMWAPASALDIPPLQHEGSEFLALDLEWKPNTSLRASGACDKMTEAQSKAQKIITAWQNASVMLAQMANFETVNKAFEEMHKKEIEYWAEVLAGMVLRCLRIRENSNLWMACEFHATNPSTQNEPDGESIGECDSERSSEEEDDGSSMEDLFSHSDNSSEEDSESNDDDDSDDDSDDSSDDSSDADDDTAPEAPKDTRADKRGLEDADDANSIKEQQAIKRVCNR